MSPDLGYGASDQSEWGLDGPLHQPSLIKALQEEDLEDNVSSVLTNILFVLLDVVASIMIVFP